MSDAEYTLRIHTRNKGENMKRKQGRPSDPSKAINRRHQALLSTQAEIIIRRIVSQRPSFNFSQYVSECIVRDFGNDPTLMLRRELAENQKQIDLLYEKNNELASKLKAMKEKEIDQEDMKKDLLMH